MKKVLGLILVFAIAFQATTAMPQQTNPFNPLLNFLNTVGDSLAGAAGALLNSIGTVVDGFSKSMNDVVTSLAPIPSAGYTLALSMFNVTDSVTTAALTQVRNQLTELGKAVQLPSLVQLIKDVTNSVAVLPAQIAAKLGSDVADVAKTLQSLANSSAPKAAVEAAVKALDDLVKVATTGIAGLPKAADLEKLSKDLSTSIESLLKPLVDLAKSTNANVKELANQALGNANNLIADMTLIVQGLVNTAINATQTVANGLKNIVQTIASDISKLTSDTLKAVTTAASNIFDGQVKAAKSVLDQATNAFNSVKPGITTLNLRLAPLSNLLKDVISQATALATSTNNKLETFTNAMLDQVQKTGDDLSEELNALFSGVTAEIQQALNSTSEVAQGCAKTAIASAQNSLKLAQTDLTTCSKGFEPAIKSALSVSLNQVANAFEGASTFFGNSADCIKNFVAGTMTNAQATTCLPLSSAFNNTVKTMSSGLDILFKDLSSTATNLEKGVQTCFDTNIASAKTRFDDTITTFKACTPA